MSMLVDLFRHEDQRRDVAIENLVSEHHFAQVCKDGGVLGFTELGNPVRAYLVGKGGQVLGEYGSDPSTSPSTQFAGRLTGHEAARRSGRMWGSAFQGNPWDLARSYGIQVNMASRREIESVRQPPAGKRVMGYTRQHRGIWIDESLCAADQDETLAHELAHVYDPSATEELCDVFAAAFLQVEALGRAA